MAIVAAKLMIFYMQSQRAITDMPKRLKLEYTGGLLEHVCEVYVVFLKLWRSLESGI